MNKKIDKGWIVAIVFLVAFVASFFVGSANPDLAEPIMKLWCVFGVIAFVIMFIVRMLRIRNIFK